MVCDECAILTAVLLGLATSLINKSSSPEGKCKWVAKPLLSKNIKSIKVTDKVTEIKVNEVVKLISKLKSSKVITESQILSLLRYTELHNELQRVFKWKVL